MTTVLIADDVKDMRNLLAQVAESAGYEVLEASTGDEVLQFLQDENCHIDLILLDIEMPNMNGIQAMHMIRDIDPDLKVCFVSGSKDKSVVSSAIQAGGNDYVVKPIDVAILIQKMKKLLGESAESSFATIETRIKASFSQVPIAIDLWVTELSEVGLKFESPMPLKQGERVELAIPKLAELIDEQINFSCQIDNITVDKKTSINTVICSFFGNHENVRTKIRSLTTKGIEIVEEDDE